MIGTTLYHFKIISELGQGGMEEGYLAEDTKLGREVAIKTMPAEVGLLTICSPIQPNSPI